MKLICFTLLTLVLSVDFLFAGINVHDVIPSEYNANTKILAKTLIIRYAPQNNDKQSLLASAANGYRVVAEIFPANLSIRNNKRLMEKAIARNLDIHAILKAEDPLLRTYVIEYTSDLSPEKYAKVLKNKNHDIELAEPFYVPALQSYNPNDPLLYMQSHFVPIKAFEAWEIEKGNPNVIIGISDNGVLYTHPDLENSIGLNIGEIPDNGIDDDGNGFIDDYYGFNLGWEYNGREKGDPKNESCNHGTNVSGIAQASTDNQKGVAGVGFGCKICPIKIDSDGCDTIPFAYLSLIYAALRGVSVLNMSWGSVQPYSDYELSVINYAIAYDVALVAAAGNIAPGETYNLTYYPSGYPGVLGVGQTNDNDVIVINSSTVGLSCDIFAPGNIFTTDVNNTYTMSSPGTSFATPVVSGAVALVRSHFPNLKAEQALEVVRQTADDISELNPFNIRKLIPGRVNLLKAVTADPLSIPGIKFIKAETFDTKGNSKVRFLTGDTVIFKLKAKNLLGAANNLNFTLSEAFSMVENTITIIQPTVSNINVTTGQEFEIAEFKLVVQSNTQTNVIMRVDIAGENNYKDFFKFLFIPARYYTDFQNDQIEFSMADNGEFGFDSNLPENGGLGFSYYRYTSNQIYKNSNGLIIAAGTTKAAASFYNDFLTLKGYDGADYNTGIVKSVAGPNQNQLGLEITQKAGFVSTSAKSAKIEVELKNINDVDLSDVSVGYFIDFDLFDLYENNSTKPFAKGVPDDLKNIATAQIISSTAKPQSPFNVAMKEYPVFGVASISNESGVHPQAAGLNRSVSVDLTYGKIHQALTSGTSWQVGDFGDVSVVIGMGFEGALAPEQVKKCSFCIAVGRDEDDLANELQTCLKNQVAVKDYSDNKFISINPNPAMNYIQLQSKCPEANFANIKIYDIFGKVVVSQENILTNGGYFNQRIDVSDLPIGCYVVYVEYSNSEFIYSKFIKVE
ncbi:MAG: S8/S53 family peptidase [bacterium]